MINTLDTVYPKNLPISKAGLIANRQYYEHLAKKASKEYADALLKISNIIDKNKC